MDIKYDGMPKKKEEKFLKEINEDELIGYIMRQTHELGLNYEEVSAVLDAETNFMIEKGYMDAH